MALDPDAARAAIAPLARRLGFTLERTAHGILGVVAANMVRAIRTISVERGHDPRRFTLMPFGGAGPLHASEVAKALGIRRILVPAAPGILCAQGLVVSDLKEDFVAHQRPPVELDGRGRHPRAWSTTCGEGEPGSNARTCQRDARTLERQPRSALRRTELRAAGAGRSVAALPDPAGMRAAFFARARDRLWLPQPDDPMEVVNFRLTARGRPPPNAAPASAPRRRPPQPQEQRAVWFEPDARSPPRSMSGRHCCRATRLAGPAVIEQLDATTLLPGRPRDGRPRRQPRDRSRHERAARRSIDPITLEILANALRSITDETYAALMKSAYSTNIKERHDHSTAIMDRRAAGRAGASSRCRSTSPRCGG